MELINGRDAETLVVPVIDTTANLLINDVIGNKSDAAATGVVSTVKSVMAYVKQLVTSILGLETQIDNIEEYTLDQRMQYLYVDDLTSGGYDYVGYEDKDGNYYIVRYDSDKLATYATGTGGIPSVSPASNWSGLDYNSPADTTWP